MKKLILLITALMMAFSSVFAARLSPATGQVVDEAGKPIEFATVVLLKDKAQVTGITTGKDGRFTLKVVPGDYTLSIQFLGYEPINQPISIAELSELGQFTLRASTTQIQSVEVKAQLIRREADRFVVDVANAPAAIGKDGIELLEITPGIWIDGEKITINGKSGSKVYINERELRMEPAQLLTYLRSLRAEEIQKIEVVPTSGADYDADSSGGVIKITLRKRRENGLDGSLSLRSTQADIQNSWSPSGNINIHSGRMDLYASAWGQTGHSDMIADEQTHYTSGNNQLASHSEKTGRDRNFGASVGAVYEIDKKNSIGAEFEYWRNKDFGPNDSYTDFTAVDPQTKLPVLTRTDSHFYNDSKRDSYSATFNYIRKIDTLGSTFKVLADYTRRGTDGVNDNRSRITAAGISRDSLYRDYSTSVYNITTATLALDKKFSPRWSLRAGAKYTYNDMSNDALYEYQKDQVWTRNDRQSFAINYTEHIAAAYAIGSANLGRLSFVAGLRGEYTHTYGKNSNVGQDYFSLFPNANISYSLSKNGAYSLIAQYARTIERPRFWALNPQRMQISDYSYQTGNPDLDPSYKQDISLTLVLKYKYTFTGGVMLQKGEIQQTMQPDVDDPNLLRLMWVNFDDTKSYYLSANLPFQFTKWWSLNANATYLHRGQRVDLHAPEEFFNYAFLSFSTTFNLPAKFFIDLSYRYQSRVDMGNIWVESQNRLQAGIKKRFGDKFTVSFSARNLLNERQVIGGKGEGFVRTMEIKQPWNNRNYQIGVTYNFKSGKAFKRKAVEAGSAEEKSRL